MYIVSLFCVLPPHNQLASLCAVVSVIFELVPCVASPSCRNISTSVAGWTSFSFMKRPDFLKTLEKALLGHIWMVYVLIIIL